MHLSLAKRHEENLLLSVEPIADYFKDDAVTDLYINPDGKLFIKQFGRQRQFTGRIIDADITKRIINFTASMTGKVVNEKRPVLSAIMPYFDLRIHAYIPPWVSAPSICVRKKYMSVIPLERFVDEDRLTQTRCRYLLECINKRKNTIIAGGTGSGKTTFLNSLINAIANQHPQQRLYIVEDTGEVICTAADYVTVCVQPEKTVEAVRGALRYYPDRILFGELRYGDTALELVKAWKTGHPGGLATLHAESGEDVLSRVRDLIMENIEGRITKGRLADVINTSVFLEDIEGFGPKITALNEISVNKDTKRILYRSIK